MTDLDNGLSVSVPESANQEDSQLDKISDAADAACDKWIGRDIGDYSILSKLGHGGMGLVLQAYQKSAHRNVAIKIIRADRMYDHDGTRAEESIARFKSEARAAAQLKHQNIITIYEIGQFDGHHFFSMQLVNGQSLGKICKDKKLSPKETARYMVPICRALQHAHNHGILHRDIKPGNIMVDEDGRPLLTDFGLAKWFEDDDHSMTRSGQIFGTATYMSPQQAIDASRSTIACDVYSLGATIYHLITGRPPFEQGSLVAVLKEVLEHPPKPPRKLDPSIDADTETIVLKCLEKEPTARYRTADELGDELQRVLDGKPILARPVSNHERLWRWCKRNPLVASLTASAMVFLIAAVFASTIGYRNVSLANNQIRNHLRDSLFDQAQLLRSSKNAGYRNKALAALSEAASIRPGVDVRNEYAAYSNLPDIELLHDIKISNWHTGRVGYADGIADSNRVIAVADGEKPLEIDIQTGRCKQIDVKDLGPFQLDLTGGSTFLAKISADGNYLAGNSLEKKIEIWDLSAEERLGELKNEQRSPVKLNSLVFDVNGKSIFCAGKIAESNGRVQLYRFGLPKLELLETWQEEARGIDCLSVIGEEYLVGRLLADKTYVVIWTRATGNAKTEEKTRFVADERNIQPCERAIVYEREFRRIYCGKGIGSFGAHRFPSGISIGESVFDRHSGLVNAADVSPDGQWMASSGEDRMFHIWDLHSGKIVSTVSIDTIRAKNTQWLANGKMLMVDSNNGLQIWKFVAPSYRQFFLRDELGRPQMCGTPLDLEFDSQEQSLFCNSQQILGRLDLYNMEAGFEFLPNKNASQLCLYVSQDGKGYATHGHIFQDNRPIHVHSIDAEQSILNIERSNEFDVVYVKGTRRQSIDYLWVKEWADSRSSRCAHERVHF